MRLNASSGKRWTAYVLGASASQRAGTFVATLYFVHAIGADRFAGIVPLLPVAPLVGAAAIVGQEQAVLRFLVSRDATRLASSSVFRIMAFVGLCGLAISVPLAAVLPLAFNVSAEAALAAGFGGTLLAMAQATLVGQIRAIRSGPAYLFVYALYGIAAIAARALGVEAGIDDDLAWAVGDVGGGIAALLGGWVTSQMIAGAAQRYDVRKGTRYGAPLVPHSLAQQVLSNADRWIFAGRVSASQLTAYVAVYQIANVVNIALAEVNRSRQHRYVGLNIAEAHRIEHRERSLLLAIIFLLSFPVACASALLVPGDTSTVVAIAIGICASFTSIALYLPLANLVSLTAANTGALARASSSGAAANVLLNVALVGQLGIWSGMVANLLGFFVMFLVLTRYAPK